MKSFFFLTVLLFIAWASYGQDSLIITQDATIQKGNIQKKEKDSTIRYNTRRPIIRSAIIPGWGQVTNHKIWKVPIVYAALGATTYLFVRNLHQYRDAKQAFILASDNDPSNDYLIKQPYFNVRNQPERIRSFRNEVRQNMDYCGIFFILFWGLNVVDAAVDAHLKTFDVSDDLSIQFKPGYSPASNTTGLSVVLNIGR